MRGSVRGLLLVGLAAGVAACGGGPSGGATSADGPGAAFRLPAAEAGRLFHGADGLAFVACGTNERVALEDTVDGEAAELFREFSGMSSLMAMVRIEDGQLREIRYAGPEGPGCDRLPPAGAAEARGNEPFWSIGIDGSTATLYTPDQPDGAVFDAGAWTRPDDASWRFTAQRALEGGATQTMALVLEAARCADSMSGARFPFRATLTLDNRRMDGCGLEGRAAEPPTP